MAIEFGPGRFITTCYAEDTTTFASDEEEGGREAMWTGHPVGKTDYPDH